MAEMQEAFNCGGILIPKLGKQTIHEAFLESVVPDDTILLAPAPLRPHLVNAKESTVRRLTTYLSKVDPNVAFPYMCSEVKKLVDYSEEICPHFQEMRDSHSTARKQWLRGTAAAVEIFQEGKNGLFSWTAVPKETIVFVQAVDNAGYKGVFATQDIIMKDTLLYQGEAISCYVSSNGLSASINSWAMQICGTKEEHLLKELYPRNTIEGTVALKIAANAFRSSTENLLYLFGSLFNHSCVANAYRDIRNGVMYVFNTQYISKGSEVFIHYLDEITTIDNVHKRKEIIKKKLGFDCTCSACRDQTASQPWDLLYHFSRLYHKNVPSENCAWCGKKDVVLKKCTACKFIQYCGRECQVQHWRCKHRKQCMDWKENPIHVI